MDNNINETKNDAFGITIPNKWGETINGLIVKDINDNKEDSSHDIYVNDFSCNITSIKRLKGAFNSLANKPLTGKIPSETTPILFMMCKSGGLTLERMVNYLNNICGEFNLNLSVDRFTLCGEVERLHTTKYDLYILNK
jgi:hypothetical protein